MALSSTSRARALAVLAVAVTVTACSLIVDTTKDQCTTAADCSPSVGAMCVDGVCVGAGVGVDASVDGNSSDAPAGDALVDGGCVPKAPTSQEDFLNEKCTNAQCITFDNCARVGLCPGVDGGDGGLPALVTPPLGGI
jgi:hypothetical protein